MHVERETMFATQISAAVTEEAFMKRSNKTISMVGSPVTKLPRCMPFYKEGTFLRRLWCCVGGVE